MRAVALLLVLSGCSRSAQLGRVIDLNVGFMHLTRGCNQHTVEALRREVTLEDVPILVRMLDDRDHVHQLAAAYVLALLPPDGVRALQVELEKVRSAPALNFEKWDAIGGALRGIGGAPAA